MIDGPVPELRRAGRCALPILLEKDTAGVRVLAEQCAAGLRDRHWDGDEELASELDEDSPDPDDPQEWLLASGNGSRKGYRDMEWFIVMLDDARVADRLSIAIDGKGAFGRLRG